MTQAFEDTLDLEEKRGAVAFARVDVAGKTLLHNLGSSRPGERVENIETGNLSSRLKCLVSAVKDGDKLGIILLDPSQW